MKVIGFNGSPRKGANTETLVKAVLKGAAGKGAETRLVNLNELSIKGCQGCDACKNDLGTCVQKDDISPLLQEMKECDAIVLGTPIYWFHVSSQFKALIDRFYCFFGWEPDPDTGELKEITTFPKDKKFVIVTSRGDEENTKVLPQLYGYIHEWLNIIAAAMRSSSTEIINHYGSWNLKDSALNDSDLIARAESVGASLV
ncbi:MAG: flavodoxin family protein [Candidatus Hydrogenedentota bacterium]|nr:MAG: flavodoxin family protein [Candidatus Hydrogenedentota bacterium]